MLTQNVIVLGASSAIGRVLAHRAASSGERRVLAVARSEVPESLAPLRGVTCLSGIDLCSEKSLNTLAATAQTVFQGRGPFAAVHCVGDFWRHAPLTRTPLAESLRVVQSNINTLIGAATALTPVMIAAGGGRFVTFSCNSVRHNFPNMAPFTAAKAAVESFTRSLSNECAPQGVSAFAVALSSVATEKVMRDEPNGDHAHYLTPEVVADFVLAQVLTLPHQATGNVLSLFEASPSFFGTGYFDRHPQPA